MGKIFETGIVLSFVNQKGGVGKSTLASIFANHLFTIGRNADLNLSIAVVDSDDLQRTLYRKRERELSALNASIEQAKNENEKNELENFKSSYKVIQISSKDVPEQIDILKSEYDIILLDLPGNMKQDGVITDYFLIDVMIIPFQPNEFDIDSTIQFYELLNNDVIKSRLQHGFKTTVAGVFNRVNSNTKEFKELYSNKAEFPFPVLNNYVTESKVAYQRNINTLGDNNIQDAELCDEILNLIINHNKQ